MARNKKSSTADTIVRAVAFIVIGIFLIIYWSKDFMNSFKEPAYLYEQKTADITDGAYLQEDIYAALDYFMYEETSRTKYGVTLSSSTTSYYYIVPVLTEDAGDLYMAVEVDAADEATMTTICDNTYSYLMGELSDEELMSTTYHVTGNIRNMEQEELDFMVEWFQQTQYFGTTDTAEIMNYIHPVMLEKYSGTSARAMVIVGIVFIVIGTIILLVFNNIRRKKKESEAIIAAASEAHAANMDPYAQTDAAYTDPYSQTENTYSQDSDLYNSTYNNQ